MRQLVMGNGGHILNIRKSAQPETAAHATGVNVTNGGNQFVQSLVGQHPARVKEPEGAIVRLPQTGLEPFQVNP